MSNNVTPGDFLQKHAYDNVWCTPEQDRQAIVKPKRLTPIKGAWLHATIQWKSIALPNKSGRFHVYQIGQIHPSLLGLFDDQGKWLSLSRVCESQRVLIDLYTGRGIMVPRFMSWYMVTSDRNLILAVELPTPRMNIDLDNEPVFMRVYTNAYFQSTRSTVGVGETVVMHGVLARSVDDVIDMQVLVNSYRAKSGAVLCYVNGKFTNTIDLITARVGDYIEFTYDASIVKIIDFTIDLLREFTSELDGLRKYLLHHNDTVDTIDYHDDIDTYLFSQKANGMVEGVLYHKNLVSSMRMVTHRDYSVPVQRVVALAYVNDFLGENTGLKLKLFVRKSGWHRPLVYESNRIAELYKLSESERIEAMTGLHAVVPVWQAHHLELSQYTEIMKSDWGKITRSLVQEAYGYNALSVLLGDTPRRVRVASGQLVVDVPAGLQGNCTVYEYDADGLLLGWDYNGTDDLYSCVHPNASAVEMIYGHGSRQLDLRQNVNSGPYEDKYNYRFYRSKFNGPISDGVWSDVTGEGTYIASDGTYTFSVAPDDFTAVLSNKKHLTYGFDYFTIDGLIQFNLTYFDGTTNVTLPFPLGELDIFMNQKALLEGLDYVVNFPTVTVINKEYLKDPEDHPQSFVVRYTGFCNKDMVHSQPPEVGFVRHGVLSHNKRYDLRDDRVMRIVCAGQMYLRDEVSFAEDNPAVIIADAKNGSPYSIRDIVVPMNNYLTGSGAPDDKTYVMRQNALVVDTMVSDYLSERLPMVESSAVSVITDRYKVVSPFFAKIIHDLKDGFLWDDRLHQQYGGALVKELCAFYEPLLSYDPITIERQLDDKYVVIHPHDRNRYIELGIYQYKFLLMVVEVYANKKLEIASFVSVAEF